jgi:hypothetical protein
MSVLSVSQDMGLEDNIHYSIERPTQFTWRLRVRAIQVTDEGTYECFVLTTLNSRANDKRTIVVVFKPYLDLQQTSSDQGANEGEDIDLQCNATGKPEPTIEWSRLGGALLPNGQEKYLSSVLKISNIKAEHRGVYRCLASNSVGMASTDININVRFAPEVTRPRKTIEQAVGYRVELQCYGEGNPTPTSSSVAWVKGSTTYTKSSDAYEVRFVVGAFNQVSYELIIYSVQESNYGTYTCRMKNSIGTTTKTIELIQTDVPQPSIKTFRVIAGATLTRSCLVTLVLCLCTVRLLN